MGLYDIYDWGGEILKQDACGRVRVPVERREALLDEFERSALSGVKFAHLAGVKYATFANWVQQRRQRRTVTQTAAAVGEGEDGAKGGGRPIRLFEAVLEGGGGRTGPALAVEGLVIELPGGSRVLVGSPAQLPMAVEMIALVAQRIGARC